MSRESVHEADDDEEEDDIGEDLEDLRRACMVSEANSDEVVEKSGSVGADGGGGGEIPSDSENEDDFEMLGSIKSQLASSTGLGDGPLMGLSVPSDSESEDDLEMLRSIKRQLALSMDASVPPMGLSDDDEDDSFETLCAIRRRFSAFENSDPEVNLMNDSPGKKKQVHASDNEPSREILSRSNTCESFPNHDKSVVTVPDSEGVQAGNSVEFHENTAIEPFDQLETCQSSLLPAASSSFPESAQAFVDAIRRNRSYQKFLRRKLTEIEVKIEQNEKHKRNVKIVQDFQASCKRITKQALSQRKDPRVELISTRKSGPRDSSEGNDKKTSPLTLGPLENPCVANYRMAIEKYPVSVDRRNWTTEENEYLAKGLKQQFQETLLNEAIERSSDSEGSTQDIYTINESIKNLEITPEMIRQFLPKVNWDQLASIYIKDRSAAECEARWMSSEDPLINHSPWTAEEENNLLLIIQKNCCTDWLDIAVSLGMNRTPFECLAKYQRSLNADILRREWTPEEDKQLRAAVGLFGENDWQSVADALEGRAGKQCANRWKWSLHPTIEKKGRWSSEEDKRVKVAVTLFGAKNWHKIAQFVPGRTQVQCRERWVNSLDPKVNRDRWTKEEDAKLREAITEHGYSSWSKVASRLSRRTDSQCRRRWKSLYPHQAAVIQEATRSRREAIVGNFVDRESERPALLAGDFLALPEISLESEPEIVSQKKKCKARRKKSDVECEITLEPEPEIVSQKKKCKARRKKSDVECGVTLEPEPEIVSEKKKCKARRKKSDVDCEITLEPEPEIVSQKKKCKAKRKKSDVECESEASCAPTERQPKRRRKGLEGRSGDVCRQESDSVCENDENNGGVRFLERCNENQENVKEKRRRSRRNVAATSSSSTVTINCSQVKVGIKKLKPRRRVY
ncbi:myb-like protein L isoform X2 [Eutrema salsugineum]|uniref:myb-like protein L isoform X2 n=1 Tax=Eutrema salsugineum TaxID=72664 RepID=UPI000CED488A|nr:myb-like protein L isoform X2 [Eutrema salsugineum]